MHERKAGKRPAEDDAFRGTPLTGYETLSILEAALLAYEYQPIARRVDAGSGARCKSLVRRRKAR